MRLANHFRHWHRDLSTQRLTDLLRWLREHPKAMGNVSHIVEDLEHLIAENERLTRIAQAARRLDAAIIEHGTSPHYIGDLRETLHALLIEGES